MNSRFSKYHLTVIMFLMIVHEIPGQMIGIPFVESYDKEQYSYGTQNWDIKQGETGMMYFANNEGLMEFDGSTWNLFPLPNKTILRSLLIKDGNIYGGGQNEFGVYLPDQKEKWRFQSLKIMIPAKHQNFEDVWRIENLGERIYFRASDKIYILKGNSCKVLDSIPIHYLGKAGKVLFAQSKQGTLYNLEDDILSAVPGSQLLYDTEVRDVITVEDGFLIATYKKGLFLYDGSRIQKWENQGEKYFENQFINALAELNTGDIVIGTGFHGVLVVNSKGKLLYHVSIENGLTNNRVNRTFVDQHKNLWLGLDSGISMILTNSPFSRIYPDMNSGGSGYDVEIFNDKIYFGTSTGLYYTTWKDQRISDGFTIVENTNGQVWGLDVIEDQLILSHHEGAFIVTDGTASKFFNNSGVWTFNQDISDEDLIFSGNYNGISIFDRETFTYLYDIPGLKESSRFIAQDQSNNYWISHPYKGIYKIANPQNPELSKVEQLGINEGLPSQLQNHIFYINEEILICSEKGVFTFDNIKNKFIPYQPINEYLGDDVKVRRLFEGNTGDFWYITENEIGILEIKEKGLKREISQKAFPELMRLLNNGFENIYTYGENHAIINTTTGFIHFNGNHSFTNTPNLQVVLSEMRINQDSVLYPLVQSEKLTFSHDQNDLLFKFGVTEYSKNQLLKFQFLLEGYDEKWTLLSTLRTKEYNNLSPGEYRLQARSISPNGNITALYSLDFDIKVPWYSGTMAKAFYLLFFLSVGYLIYKRLKKKYKVMEQIVDTTVKSSKEEIQRLETEKIQAELNHKKRELVSATIHLVKKNESFSEIIKELNEIKKGTRDAGINSQLQELISSLKKDEVFDQSWEQVMYHFNAVHENYFERMKDTYQNMTTKDLKLCAYLKMNLSTKEMATLMNLSIRGVEASRYRLRKKLGLSSRDNLNEFLMSF